MPDGFFENAQSEKTLAIIQIGAGELCAWRFDNHGTPGAVGTRLTFDDPGSFKIRRDDGKYLELDVTKDCAVHCLNRETDKSSPFDDTDWLWYYVATGSSSCHEIPDSFELSNPCDAPLSILPLSLGCSNSQWP